MFGYIFIGFVIGVAFSAAVAYVVETNDKIKELEEKESNEEC